MFFSSFRDRLLKQHQQETEYLEAATVALEQHYDEISSVARQDEQFTRNNVKTLVGYFSMSSFIAKPDYKNRCDYKM